MNFDFIIVGAGSAGCVLANKLSKSGKNKVLLVEAGGSDKSLFIQMPIGYGITFFDKNVNWCFSSEKEKYLNNRNIYFPRGKVIGGSSSINGLVYHRGQKSDYDDWEKDGNLGWNYNALKSYFDKYEQINLSRSPLKNEKLSVSYVEKEYHPLKEDFYKVCNDSGLKYSKSSFIEGEGVGPYYITTNNGLRCSSSKAFLNNILYRKNLKVIKKTLVSKILIKNNKAYGIETVNSYKNTKVIKNYFSSKEVILSAGAINSPQILQLSGIGSSNTLKKHGIKVLINNPFVGQNLQDHLGVSYYFKSKVPSLNKVFGKWTGRITSGIQYVFNRKGPFSVGVNHIGGLIKTSKNLNSCNMQLYLNPHSYQEIYKNSRRLFSPDGFNGFNYSYNSCRPHSRGSVEIKSSDINDNPIIKPNYMSSPKDEEDVIKMTNLIGKLYKTKTTQSILSESSKLNLSKLNDRQIIEDFKNRASTVFHPCGTCKMSSNKKGSVVNSKLQVHGIDGLRVVDASVFPNITSANINAPTLMLAHKASDIILNQ